VKNIFLGFLLSSLLSASGLWLANVEVDAVNELHSGSTDKTTTKKVKYPFDLELVLHSGEKTRLLKEVFIMQTKGDEDKKKVLVIDQAKIMDYEGVIRRGDNRLVALRFSTPSFDFSEKFIELSGKVEEGQKISGTVVHTKNHPTNPFRHQFHPNHKIGKDITRTFEISISKSSTGGVGTTKPSEGQTALKGTYKETITGVHKLPMVVSGTVRLYQINTITELIGE
jgi:hypothetical protein